MADACSNRAESALVRELKHPYQHPYGGIGTAASWATAVAGRAWGCDPIVLQATEMGLPIYERMGFRTVVRYITFPSGGGSARS